MEELKPNLNEYPVAPNLEVLIPAQSPFSGEWYKLPLAVALAAKADLLNGLIPISQVPIGAGQIIPTRVLAGANLGSPVQSTIYYAPAGTYTTPTGTITTTENLNMLFWDKVAWSFLGVPVGVDLNPYTKNVDFLPVQQRTSFIKDFVDNTDFAYILLDAKNRILGGWKNDGSFYVSKFENENIPGTAIRKLAIDYQRLGTDVTGLLPTLLDELSGYVYVILDSKKRILFGVETDGSFYVSKFENEIIPGTAIKKLAIDFLRLGTDVTALLPTSLDETSGFVYVVLDSKKRILFGVETDGSFYVSKFENEIIPGTAIRKLAIDYQKLGTDVTALLPTSLDETSGYVYAVLDSKKRILFGVLTDGTFYVAKGALNITAGSLTLDKLATDIQQKINTINGKDIVAWGDSLTNGSGGNGTTYLTALAALMGVGYNYINNGVGGESVPTIAARQGGVPCFISQSFVLPADLTPVTISSVAVNNIKNALDGSGVSMLKQGEGGGASVNPVFVQGVECTLSWTGSSIIDPNGTWTLRRNVTASTPRTIIANSTITTSGAKKYRRPYAQIMFIGQNGGYATPQDLIAYYRAMIEFSGCVNTIVIGLHSGTAASRAALETAMLGAFGLRYINWREYIASYGLTDAGITPTAADNTAIAEGSLPPSFWASGTDNIHLNATGYALLGRIIHRRFLQLGFI